VEELEEELTTPSELELVELLQAGMYEDSLEELTDELLELLTNPSDELELEELQA